MVTNKKLPSPTQINQPLTNTTNKKNHHSSTVNRTITTEIQKIYDFLWLW